MKIKLALTLFLSILVIQISGLPFVAAQVTVSRVQIAPARAVQVDTKTVEVVTPAAQAVSAGAVAPAAATPAAGKKTPEQKKVELLLKAKFDRSTPSVLKVWSQKQEQVDVKDGEPEPLIAVVENAYKGLVVLNCEKPVKFKVGDLAAVSVRENDSKDDGQTRDIGNAKILSVDEQTVTARFVANVSSGDLSKADANSSDPVNDKADEEVAAEVSQDEPADEKGSEQAEGSPADQVSNPETADENVAAGEEQSNKNESELQPDYLALKNGDRVLVIESKTNDKQESEDKKIQQEVEQFVRAVTLGNWTFVKKTLATIKPDEADKVYTHLLKSLSSAAPQVVAGAPTQRQRGQTAAKPNLSPDDVLQLANASPKDIRIPEPEKSEESSTLGADSTAALPAGIELPAGMTIDQLPPQALKAMQQQAGQLLPSGAIPAATATTPGAPAAKPNHIAALAQLISNSKSLGHDYSKFYEQLKTGTRHFGGDDPIKKLSAADLLMKAGLTDFVEAFLPGLENEETKSNLAALKIWSELSLKKHAEEKVADWLEKAWNINKNILLIEDIEKTDKDKALANLIELSSQIEKETGVEWVNASFTEMPERGMTILTNLGTKSAELATKANQTPEDTRLKLLKLQNEAVEKLIKISPEKAESWKQALTLLAQNWLTEAEISLKYSKQNSRRDHMSIDMYGNYFWMNQNNRNMAGNGRQPRPIKLGDVIEVAPSDQWQQLVDNSLHTNFRKTKANLFLRINEEDKAFPYIEEIATGHPEVARDLIHEFLRIWTKNHDPNTDRRQRNPYIYFYGFDQKAEAIPLTRSKQERNLQELAGWVGRIRKLPIEDVDEELLANAFTTCHSSAEVFKLERFRSVFGDLDKLKPETIAAICRKMRENLSANWRDVRNQEAKQTNRREPEVQQEVLRGYDVALQLVGEALEASPDDWKLHLAKATLMYDQNAYSQTVQKSSEFSDRRDESFRQFALAADKYNSIVPSLEDKDQSTDVYDVWFYAGMGACDLGKITSKTVADLRQYELIRKAIEGLPGSLAESHMAKFANNLFTRMSPIKPEIKFRYLRGGFEIVGDHPRAWEARNLYDYYKDLVSEIKFSVVIDGEDVVGEDKPFGVYVNIIHTQEIERESGGFGKYVQNQNNMMYAWNYGRPTENYRDKFNDTAEQALGEHFEILNVTFQSADSIKSRPAAEEGWRVTPFAYVLLKPKGPQVDRIAPLKLDLDFLDTSGYVVIPIESPALVVDCSSDNPPMRPISDLKITQTLDERQADDGKLIVEISASGKGLVPDLDKIVDLKRESFELVSVDDQGVLPSTFEKDTDDIQILSDRSWTVEYEAAEAEKDVESFSFSDVVLEGAESKFQRYEDADLVEAGQTVGLEKSYASFSWNFLYWLIPAIVLGLFGVAGIFFMATRPKAVEASRFNMPDDVNPFTVLTLLKDIKSRNGISNEKGRELERSINRIEQYYFGEVEDEQPEDLAAVAQAWLKRAK